MSKETSDRHKDPRLPTNRPTPEESNGYECTDETSEVEIDNTMNSGIRDHAVFLIQFLITVKKLPSLYFFQGAEAAGIEYETYKNWRIRDWPNVPIRNDERVREILEALIQVYERIIKYPFEETYWQALERLKRRVEELKAHPSGKITHNRISQFLNMSHPTLENILSMTESGNCRPNHCPWDLLEKLKNAEEEIRLTPHIGAYTPPGSITDRRERSEPDTVKMEDAFRGRIIEPKGNCWHCGASWPNLTLDDETEETDKYRMYVCIQCTRTNVIKTPIIERYGPCGHCESPWHNLEKTGNDRKGNSIYLCPHCSRESLVINRRPRSQAQPPGEEQKAGM